MERPFNCMRIKFASLPVNVAFARVAVAAFASQLDFTVTDIEEIKVAVSEAVANAITHGYDGRPDETVTVESYLYADRIEIVIGDNGKGTEYRPGQYIRPGRGEEGEERLGLGFIFMESFMDQVYIDSQPGVGTKVRLVKKTNPPVEKKRND